MPPPTIAPPSQADPGRAVTTATAEPTPVRIIAAIKDKKVRVMLYPLGIPGENASMAMKWVAQIPKPLEMAETDSQTPRMRTVDLRTWWSKARAAKEAKAQMTAARTTSRKS